MNQTSGIVACSNAVDRAYEYKIQELRDTLKSMGIDTILSNHIYDMGYGYSGTGKERAEALMKFYRDDVVDVIYDISGGDIANEILPYLDYDVIGASNKQFWGYSDLTTIMNAIYAKTGNSSVLYQVRNLIGREWGIQCMRFEEMLKKENNLLISGKNSLFDVNYDFIQGERMEGILVGGNIRCLLKLAGTEYWPDMTEKILFLEARSGQISQIITYFSQLKQLGVFEEINGLFLGTFSELETCVLMPQVKDILRDYIDETMPVAMTKEVGHGADSKALVIGERISMRK
jgi:muramoyltetrapeptide carboxypeptidase LdcA involved in peptidoglycan recycling